MLENFSNRELAIGFWLLILLVLVIYKKDTRHSLWDFLKAFFDRKLIGWHISMVLYVSLTVFILFKIGLWEFKLLKDTIIWYIVTAIPSTIKSINEAKDMKYFKEMAKNNLSIGVLVGFIVDSYNFSLICEIILIPLFVFLSLMLGIAEHKVEYENKEYEITANLLRYTTAGVGLFLIFSSLNRFLSDIKNIVLLELIKDFILPITLSMMFIPYIYFLVLYSSYKKLFMRLKFKKTIDDKYRTFLYLKILLFCRFNINKVNNFIDYSEIMKSYVKSKDDINRLFKNYKINARTQKALNLQR